MDVPGLQLEAVLVPGEAGLRDPYHLALQVDGSLLGEHSFERLQEPGLLVVLGHRHRDETAGVQAVPAVLGHHAPLALVLEGGHGDVAVVEAAGLLAEGDPVVGAEGGVAVPPLYLQAGAVGHLDGQPLLLPDLHRGVLQRHQEAQLGLGVGELLPDVLDGESGGAD